MTEPTWRLAAREHFAAVCDAEENDRPLTMTEWLAHCADVYDDACERYVACVDQEIDDG